MRFGIMLDLSSKIKKTSTYPWQVLDEDTIVISPIDQMTFEFSGVGTFVWRMLDGELSGYEIIEKICDEYEVEKAIAQQDFLDFTQELATQGLLE